MVRKLKEGRHDRATCPYIDNKSSGCKMSTHQMDVCNKQIYACTNKMDICNNKWMHAKQNG